MKTLQSSQTLSLLAGVALWAFLMVGGVHAQNCSSCGEGPKVKLKFSASVKKLHGTDGELIMEVVDRKQVVSNSNTEPESDTIGPAWTTEGLTELPTEISQEDENLTEAQDIKVTVNPGGDTDDWDAITKCQGGAGHCKFELSDACGWKLQIFDLYPTDQSPPGWKDSNIVGFKYGIPTSFPINWIKIRLKKVDEDKDDDTSSGEESSDTPPDIPEEYQDVPPTAGGQPQQVEPVAFGSSVSLMSGSVLEPGTEKFQVGSIRLNGPVLAATVDTSKLKVSRSYGDNLSAVQFEMIKEAGIYRQIRTFGHLADIVPVAGNGFEIRKYEEGQFDPVPPGGEGTPYTINAGAVAPKIVRYLPIAAGNGHYGGIQVTSIAADGETHVREVVSTSEDGLTWSVVREGGTLSESNTVVFEFDNGKWVRTIENVGNRNGTVCYRNTRRELYQVRREGNPSTVVESYKFLFETSVAINGNSNEDLVTTRVPDPGFLGREKYVIHPDGSWEAYNYYTGEESEAFPEWRGLVKEVLRPCRNGTADPALATSANAESTIMTYPAPNEPGLTHMEAVSRITTLPTVGTIRSWEKTNSNLYPTDLFYMLTDYGGVSYDWRNALINSINDESSIEYASPTESIMTHSFTYKTTGNAFEFLNGRSFASIDADGRGTLTGYEKGDFDPMTGNFTSDAYPYAPTGTFVRTTTLDLLGFSLPTYYEATKRVEISDLNGRIYRRELWIDNGGASWSLATKTTFEYPDFWPDGSPKQIVEKQDGRIISESLSLTGSQKSSSDEQGIETITVTDALGRTASVTKVGIGNQPDIVTTYGYNGLTTTMTTSSAGLSNSSSITEDLAGRTVSETNASGAVTTTSYPNGGRDTLSTLPGGLTRLITRNIEGKTVSISGTAVVDEVYSYDALSGGNQSTTRKIGDLADSPRYSTTVEDWAGRVLSVTSPSPTGSGTVSTSHGYLTGSRTMVSSTSPAGVVLTVRPYLQSSGTLSGFDVDADGSLTQSSSDRFRDTSNAYVQSDGYWWEETVEKIYETNGDPQSLVVSVVRRCLHGNPSGYASWTKKLSPAGGYSWQLVEEGRTEINRSTKSLTSTGIRSGVSTHAVSLNVNGLLVSQKGHEGSVPTTWNYDALGRPIREISPRGGVTHKGYYADGSLGTSTDHVGKTTTYEYYPANHAAAGRLMTVTNPLGKTTTYAYNALGLVTEESGDAAYKVTYDYDEYGAKNKMWTWRDATASDLTEWIYQPGTGLLLEKKDAAGKSVIHTYTATGKPATRTWARGVSTTYSYDPATGDLTGINYSDSTPDVTLGNYDRLGRPGSVSQYGIGTETMTYHPGQFAPKERYYDAYHALLPGKGIFYTSPDLLSRPTGLFETTGTNTTFLRTLAYGYSSSSGLLESITDGTQNHTYAYHPNSTLISTIHSNSGSTAWFRESRYYDTGSRLLGNRSDRMSGASVLAAISVHAYDYDELGRRQKQTFHDGSYWQYGYNDRSEVTSATRKTSGNIEITPLNSNYSYDGIGNRLTSSSAVLGDHTYTPNSLNQYATITTGDSRTAVGRAPAAWNVQVAGVNADRIGEVFYRPLTAANSTAPVWQNVIIRRDTGSPAATKYFWYAPQALTPVHDFDGNLTNDGRWTYLWDAENRLIQMETTSQATAAGHPYTKLQFAYDWQGRRIARHVWRNGTQAAPTFKSSHRWLYDGWNIVTEFTATTATSTMLTRANLFTWGLDLSGTLQGAGGVGGLLVQANAAGTAIYRAAYDGNGNIVSWTNSAASSPNNRREYDAFGNTLVSEGAAPSSFGFSTKMQDTETGLYYYGYRFYDPVTGRWPSRDPIAEKGGVNLYGFIENKSINGIDCLGMIKVQIKGEVDLSKKEPLGLLGKILDKDKAEYEATLEYVCNEGDPSAWIDPANQSVSFAGPDGHTIGAGIKIGPGTIGASLDGGWYGVVWARSLRSRPCKESTEGRTDYKTYYQVIVDVYAYEEIEGNVGVVLEGEGSIDIRRIHVARKYINYDLSCCCGNAVYECGGSGGNCFRSADR